MLIFIVVIKINRSGELNLKARGSRRARLTTGVGWRGGGALEGGEAGWRGGMGRGEVGDGEWGLTLNYLDPARQPHITVTSLFGKGLMGLWR